MFASCNNTTALIGYTFMLIAGVLAALSINYYNRGTDHSQFRTIMNYVAIGVLGLLSVLAATVVFGPLLKDTYTKRQAKKKADKEEKAIQAAAQKKREQNKDNQAKVEAAATRLANAAAERAKKARERTIKAERGLQNAIMQENEMFRLGSRGNPIDLNGRGRAQNNTGINYYPMLQRRSR